MSDDFAKIDMRFGTEGWQSELLVDGKRIPVTKFSIESVAIGETRISMDVALVSRESVRVQGYFVEDAEMIGMRMLRRVSKELVDAHSTTGPMTRSNDQALALLLREVLARLAALPSIRQRAEAEDPSAGELFDVILGGEPGGGGVNAP